MAGENRKMTFEAALSRLEEIVRSMENGNAMLDESLTLFEEGVSSAPRRWTRRSKR